MKKTNGFSLMELLVVVAVVGILAAIAYPYYGDYVMRGKLPEATSTLSDGRIKMEQYFQDNRTYTSGALAANGCPTTLQWPTTTPTNFSFTCSNLSATTYTLTATGLNTVASFTFTLDQNNAKATTSAPAGWGTTPASCWIIKKSGC